MVKQYLTRESLEKFKRELGYLKTVKRKEIGKRLEQAISFGDLTENAAYHEAKESQAFLEGKILELGKIWLGTQKLSKKTEKAAGLKSVLRFI